MPFELSLCVWGNSSSVFPVRKSEPTFPHALGLGCRPVARLHQSDASMQTFCFRWDPQEETGLGEAAMFAGVGGSRGAQLLVVAAAVVVVPRGSEVQFLMQK